MYILHAFLDLHSLLRSDIVYYTLMLIICIVFCNHRHLRHLSNSPQLLTTYLPETLKDRKVCYLRERRYDKN